MVLIIKCFFKLYLSGGKTAEKGHSDIPKQQQHQEEEETEKLEEHPGQKGELEKMCKVTVVYVLTTLRALRPKREVWFHQIPGLTKTFAVLTAEQGRPQGKPEALGKREKDPPCIWH